MLAVTALAVLTLTVRSRPGRRALARQIEYEIPEPVPGRRIFVEGLQVSGDRAKVTLRAATDLHLRVRAYGGREAGRCAYGDRRAWAKGSGPSTPSPLRRVAFPDVLVGGRPRPGGGRHPEGRADPIPPAIGGGGAVRFSVASLGWTPGSVEGTVASECVAESRRP